MSAAVFLCSPVNNGVTDTLGHAFAKGMADYGQQVNIIALRDYKIMPCTGCGFCARPPNDCLLAHDDDVENLFAIMLASKLAVFVAPVYFYGLPAHFKAFVDRGQRFWHKSLPVTANSPLSSGIFAAARKKGKLLFSGSNRTLSLFCGVMGFKYFKKYAFRGLENVAELRKSPDIVEALYNCGKKRAEILNACK